MKHKFIVTYFVLALATLSIARVFQIMFLLEPATGFYKPEYNSTHLLYITFFICVAVVLVAFAFASRRMPKHEPKVDKTLGVISLFVAVSFLISSGIDLMTGVSSVTLLSAMFSILAAIFFVIYGLSGFSDIKVPTAATLFVFPVWGFRLISSFVSFTGMANITENVYNILMLCANLYFYVLMAKIISGVYPIKSIRFAYPVGLIASLLCTICAVPRYFVVLIGQGDMLHQSIAPDISVLASAVFIAVFTLKLYSKANLDKKKHTTETINYNGKDIDQMSGEYIIDSDGKE